jgi:Uma2 family endonuclease
MSRVLTHPPRISLDGVQHFVLEDASWALYETLLKEVGSHPVRMTYDDGRLEMMSPLAEHEGSKRLIGRMIEMLTLMRDMPMKSLGSTTFRRKDRRKGVEPDECYYFKNEAKVRGRKRVDLKKDPPPDLVVEVDIAHGSIPREPIYAAFGVPEIWRFNGVRLQCLHLEGDRYAARKMSLAFPFLEPARLERFIDKLSHQEETSIIKEFIAWVRKNGWE